MEGVGRVFVSLCLVLFVCSFSVPFGSGKNDTADRMGLWMNRRGVMVKSLLKKHFLKKIFNKHRRKLMRKSRCSTNVSQFSSVFHNDNPSLDFLLLLSGDVELKPGPASGSKSKTEREREDSLIRVIESLERIEAKQGESGEKQDQMLERLSKIESDFEKVKNDISQIHERQEKAEEEINAVRNEAFSKISDLTFLIDKQEQYSRKSSVRLYDVREEENENCQDLVIDVLKKEMDVDINPEDIDIVHRVGKRKDGETRGILIKFLCHKSKEKIMRKKKEAKNIGVKEDLAPGIKGMVNKIFKDKGRINVEKVWTIDGRIKFKMNGNQKVFEIRSYADYANLMNPFNHDNFGY